MLRIDSHHHIWEISVTQQTWMQRNIDGRLHPLRVAE